jgi:hypothetical protein
VAILVDEAIWEWKGRRWAHLVTDRDPAELHDFAHRLGLPYLAFQGDHYDIHTDLRRVAIEFGARAVTGREVVTALREAGLRRRGGPEPWTWRWRHGIDPVGRTDLPEPMGSDVVAVIERFTAEGAPTEVGRVDRSTESMVIVSSPAQVEVEPGMVMLDAATTLHRSRGERGTFVEWRSAS